MSKWCICLRFLVAEDAAGMMLQTMSLQTVGGQAVVLHGLPEKKLDARRCPRFPDQLPGAEKWLIHGTWLGIRASPAVEGPQAEIRRYLAPDG
jgi:hypothetical protein